MRHEEIVAIQNNSGKASSRNATLLRPAVRRGPSWRDLSRRRGKFALARIAFLARRKLLNAKNSSPNSALMSLPVQGFDPELLFVECGRCGAPVLWDEGRATELLQQAGIDPLELDSSCLLVTDGCPACGSKKEYSVRIFRITSDFVAAGFPPIHGHA